MLAVGGFAIDDAGPGDVVPDGLGVVGEFRPDVDENEISAADGLGRGAGGFVVGVGGVGAYADVGAVLGDHVGALDGLLEEFDDGVLDAKGIEETSSSYRQSKDPRG